MSQRDNPLRDDANQCFVCGPTNPIGLNIRFRLEGELCVAEFTPGEHHVGFSDVVHGGLMFSVLDDVMANWLFLRDVKAYTAKASVRYRREARVGEPLKLIGEQVGERRRLRMMVGRAVSETHGDVVCEAEATFMLAQDG